MCGVTRRDVHNRGTIRVMHEEEENPAMSCKTRLRNVDVDPSTRQERVVRFLSVQDRARHRVGDVRTLLHNFPEVSRQLHRTLGFISFLPRVQPLTDGALDVEGGATWRPQTSTN